MVRFVLENVVWNVLEIVVVLWNILGNVLPKIY